ncbi:hypothetical protein [Arthrobacter sp. MDT2-2]
MLDEYVQQWSAIHTARAAGLNLEDIFMTFFALAGDAEELEGRGVPFRHHDDPGAAARPDGAGHQ